MNKSSSKQSTKFVEKVSILPIAMLQPDERNARMHKARQINALAKSIQSFGFNIPIAIDAQGKVIAGHARLEAAKKLGMEQVPVISLDHLSPDQIKAFTIADNRLAEMSSWNDNLLAIQLKELSVVDLNFDLEATGFTIGEIDLILENAEAPEEAAQTSVDTARADIATFRTQMAQDLNALILLVGQPIEPTLVADTGITVTDPITPLMTTIGPAAEPPSELLQRRPDVLAAERTLRAANANIGAARAARFPSITLTTSVGTASSQLSQLFGGSSGLWSFMPSVSVPIFDNGAGAANVRVAKVARDSALASYEYTIQTAFKEVANALGAQRNMSELLAARQSLLAANEKIYRLTEARYRQGPDSSLSVLTVQCSYYAAQQNMIAARLQEASNWVPLYRVLGGGWQP